MIGTEFVGCLAAGAAERLVDIQAYLIPASVEYILQPFCV